MSSGWKAEGSEPLRTSIKKDQQWAKELAWASRLPEASMATIKPAEVLLSRSPGPTQT